MARVLMTSRIRGKKNTSRKKHNISDPFLLEFTQQVMVKTKDEIEF